MTFVGGWREDLVMDKNRELIESIKAMQAIHEEMQAAVTSGLTFDWQNAMERKSEAEIRYEKALLSKDWIPPYPPKTTEGERRWGLTEDQVRDTKKYFGIK